MAITLNHTIVPCFDKTASAKFYSRVFGFEYVGVFSHFIVVRVNDTLCLDFDNKEKFDTLHYAFKVSEQEFDDIFARLQAGHIPYGSGPGTADDMTINHNYDGRGVYFRDPNGHLLEILTADYVIPPQ
ncbi:VOC family protein [Nitrosomonas oligotropha]|uniref:Catechol 2,3-dioxygenase n=1 Tax=Nitrosomonas oligotropha TaxID=42354 RepID=A0A1H8R977_9PROT|nr:VOC family protein [Nitrosomonas oligotropha]TXI35455.1 MAG: VOC family protein [Nitrosomonas sp.]SDW84519.1 Catechol 2,3-dioxygenase [Nitrosomonas oligotropha]SEO62970.1 Catechol 2,3-dioxygenase [Nitrosomonas oligotropha]